MRTSKAHQERAAQIERFQRILGVLGSLNFHVYVSQLQDALTEIKELSLEGQEQNACASHVAVCLCSVKDGLGKLQGSMGLHERALRGSVTKNSNGKAVLGEWVLSATDVIGADQCKQRLLTNLLKELDAHFQNNAYTHLGVADFRGWAGVEVTEQEIGWIIRTEKLWGVAVPELLGCHRIFHLAKSRYFALSDEERKMISTSAGFASFWGGLCADPTVPDTLRHYAACILLACPSSCDAERAISTLNRIVTALRNRMSWGSVRMHLIGAEDVDPDGYPYELVATSWGAQKIRRRKASQNMRKTRSDKGKEGRKKKLKGHVLGPGPFVDGVADFLCDSDASDANTESSSSDSSTSSSSSDSG